MLPPFEVVARRRPVALVGRELDVAAVGAPCVAVETALDGTGEVALASGADVVTARYDGRGVSLEVTAGGRTTHHRSRRDGRPRHDVDALALTLTGRHVTALTRHDGTWTARARHGLEARVDTSDETWLAGLRATGERSGIFGQVGLRDVRLVTEADGTPVRDGGLLLLSASSAGPGFFDTSHTSLWALDPASLELEHRSDLFFRRPGRPRRTGRRGREHHPPVVGVHGDHATHVVRDGDTWLVATSTWGDFDPRRRGASVGVTLSRSTADVTRGHHVLDTRPLPLPTTGLRSVGVWDPHLVHTGEGWLVAYVSATRFFRFHPVLAGGPSLDDLALRGAATDRRATEGPTLLHLDGRWVLAASDGRDNRAPHRARYPLLDTVDRGPGGTPAELGTLDAAYPTNIPWPTVVRDPERGPDAWLMIGFDGTPYGGRLVGYGSHGDVVLQRSTTG